MSPFVKEMSDADRFFVAFNEVRPPFVIHMILESQGDPSPDSLDEALGLTTQANPGSSLRVDRSGPEPLWVLGAPPTLTVLDAPDWPGDRGGPEAPFLGWHLDSDHGPTCELIYVRGAHKNYLVFRTLHAVMDGRGTLSWVKDFMRCLRGEPALGHPSTLTVDQLLRDLGGPRRSSPKPDALHPIGSANIESRGEIFWRRRTLARPLDSRATGRVAVRLAEHARRHQEGPVRLNLPSDLRHHRPGERTTGNLFSSLFIDVPPDASAEMIGLKVMQQIYRKEGARPLGANSVTSLAAHRVKIMWDLARLHETGRYTFSLTLSHLGALDRAALSAPSFATSGAYFVPVAGDAGCVLSVNGLDDHTEVCLGVSDRFADQGQLDELAQLVSAALDQD